MLLELTIKNIALIESLRIEFVQGFNVLTGETGAGKSIVVDCVNLALGGRADRDIIRNGAEKGSVQALFDISQNERALAMAEELGVDVDGGMVCVARELNHNGRNICRISGSVLPLSALRQFTSLLVDIHGQHEHQALMNPARHIDFLDSFGDTAHAQLMREAARLHAERSHTAAALKALLKDQAERERLVDMLTFQVNEIEKARLKPGEEEKLQSRMRMLENAEKVQASIEGAYRLTYAGEGGGMSAQECLLRAGEEMDAIANIDPKFARIAETLRELYYSVNEVGSELQTLSEETNFNPELLDKISNRLDLISRLERKYGPSLDEVIAFGKDARERLEAVQSGDQRMLELKKELKRRDSALRAACEALSRSRKQLAAELEKGLLEQLKDLGMGKTRFSVSFKVLEKPGANGMDEVEFLISPNPGEPLRPLAAIASGGELSRIMLALKALALDRGGVDSMVFDEIDTGVSGRMAQVVGEKMRMIAQKKQVLCVTHLPQIAALADAQFLVEKQVEGERTRTGVLRLDEEGRVRELSRLVGGSADSPSSLAHARHMLEEAHMHK